MTYNPELLKAAKAKLEVIHKRAFVPMDASGVTQGDPNAGQGGQAPGSPPPGPPAGPGDMAGAPPPDQGGGQDMNQPVQVTMNDLMQLFQAIASQGGGAPPAGPAPEAAPAPMPGAPAAGGAPAVGGESGKGKGKANIEAEIAVIKERLGQIQQLLMSILAPNSSPMPTSDVPPMGGPVEEAAGGAPPAPEPAPASAPKTASASRAQSLNRIINRLRE